MKARYIINNVVREKPIRNQTTTTTTIISQTTYQNICAMIVAMITTTNLESCSDCFTTLIGYKLTEKRSGKFYFGSPKADASLKKEWKEAMKKAGELYRQIKKKE